MRILTFEVEGGKNDFYFSRVLLETPAPPRPRRSFHRSASSLTSALSFVSSRKSFSYGKLAQMPIQLTVLKLDGSSFEICITKSAVIADLKQAIEDVFSRLPIIGPGAISWQHVWGHFCLSYGGTKLLNDSDNIKDYGIKDGDELRFVRHISLTYNLIKKRSRQWIDAPKPCTMLRCYMYRPEEEGQKVEEDYGDLKNPSYQQYKYEEEDKSTHHEPVRCRLFRRWFLYYRLLSMEQLRCKGNARTTRMGRWICWVL